MPHIPHMPCSSSRVVDMPLSQESENQSYRVPDVPFETRHSIMELQRNKTRTVLRLVRGYLTLQHTATAASSFGHPSSWATLKRPSRFVNGLGLVVLMLISRKTFRCLPANFCCFS
eukprot:107421-Chlamydomonas_euryale.AAC.5